jgi:hypothetical protein
MGAYYSGKNTFLWGYVPANRLARVTSNLYVFPGVSGAIGAIALGVLATRIVPGSLTTLAALVFAGAALMSVLLPAVRKFAF